MLTFIRKNSTLAALLSLVALAACSPTVLPAGESIRPPTLEEGRYIAADGTVLPLVVWPATKADAPPKAVILGIHGFGDYRNAWEEPAEIWAKEGFTVYAYDQRGFGGSPTRGRWAGTPTLVDDIKTVARLVRERHPGVPFYLAGESMGGALVLAAADDRRLEVDGLVLLATALRSRDTLGALLRGGLEFFAFVMPWLPIGPTSIDFQPTDNPKTMDKMRKDPMMLRNPRVDIGYGLVEAMDAGKAAVPHVSRPYLMLHGLGDRLIPQGPVQAAIELMPRRADSHLAFYRDGYHMLLRDKEGPVVAMDIVAWIRDNQAPLPSGADAERSRPEVARLWGSKSNR